MEELLRDFVAETLESIDVVDVELVRFERDSSDSEAVARIFRLVHTIKGTCGFLNLPRLELLSHAIETLMARFRGGVGASAGDVSLILSAFDRIKLIMAELGVTLREPVGDDSDILQAVNLRQDGENGLPGPGDGRAFARQTLERPLRSGEATLEELERAFRETPGPLAHGSGDDDRKAPESAEAPPPASPLRTSVRVAVERLDHLMTMVSELVLVRNQLLDVARREQTSGYKLPLQRLSNITGELQDGVMRTRMHAIGSAWANMPRIARDLSIELGKQIAIQTSGDDTEIDRQLLEVIKDSLVHMVRNAADHGIETPTERVAADKPAEGSIRLSARQEGSHIVVEVADDGRGLDIGRLKEKALGLGLIDEVERDRLTDPEAALLIFQSGFSTAGEITNLSGRGVGLDVVKTNIERAGGSVDLTNRPGHGLTVALKLPLTLAIASVLVVEAGGQLFALPQLAISELVRAQPGGEVRVETVGGEATLRVRDRLLPLIDLAKTLSGPRSTELSTGFVAICQFGTQRFGLAVDAIQHPEEIVVKPISSALRSIPYFSGATILGDGSIILILDPGGFARLANQNRSPMDVEPAAKVASGAPLNLTSLLVFKDNEGREHVVPQSQVARLDEVSCERFERLGDRIIMQYRGQIMQVHGFDSARLDRPGADQPLIVFEHRGRSAALAVSEIVDVIEWELEVDLANARAGSLGSALIMGRVMSFFDVAPLFGGMEGYGADAPRDGRPIVLLIERDEFLAAMYAPLLRGAGFEALIAGEPEAGAVSAEDVAPVAAVVDLDGPVGPAFDLARHLLRRLRHRPPILLGTVSHPTADLRRRAFEAGFAAVVGKFDRIALLDSLRDGSMTREAA